jgi:hypothetical protein
MTLLPGRHDVRERHGGRQDRPTVEDCLPNAGHDVGKRVLLGRSERRFHLPYIDDREHATHETMSGRFCRMARQTSSNRKGARLSGVNSRGTATARWRRRPAQPDRRRRPSAPLTPGPSGTNKSAVIDKRPPARAQFCVESCREHVTELCSTSGHVDHRSDLPATATSE